MAIGSCDVKAISRSSGRSATASAAYRTAEQVTDERSDLIHDYTRKGGVEHVSIHAPAGAPVMTTGELWNKAEAAEKRKDSVVARELLIALPHELNAAQRIALAERIAQGLVERYGVAAQVAVHAPGADGDKRNHHAHIMFTTRRMDASGKLGEKTRELDVKPSSSEEVRWMRLDLYQAETNAALAAAGRPERIDMRSLAEQEAAAPAELTEALAYGPPTPEQRFQIDRMCALGRAPTQHEGPRVTAIRRECEKHKRPLIGACDRIAANDAIRQDAADRAELGRVNAQILSFELALEQREAARSSGQDELAKARKALDDTKAEAERLRVALAAPQPRCVTVALELRDSYRAAAEQAARWRQEHPVQALLGKVIEPEPVRRARERLAAFTASPERAEGIEWQEQRQRQREQLAELEKHLPALQEAARTAEVRVLAHEPLMALKEQLRETMHELERLEPRMTADDSHSAKRRRTNIVQALNWSPSKENLAVACIEARELLEPALALAQRGDKERVKELVAETLRDLHLATAASSARGASDEQRDRLFALCDEVRAISEPLERRRATHDWPALEEAQKLRETARELRREGEGLSDELSRQRELQREMRAQSKRDDNDSPGPSRGPRFGR